MEDPIRIFSSAEYCLRVLRRISRTALSAGSFLLIDFCLIFVPFGHYDEPEILRYAITSICPKGADGEQRRPRTVLSGRSSSPSVEQRTPPAAGETRALRRLARPAVEWHPSPQWSRTGSGRTGGPLLADEGDGKTHRRLARNDQPAEAAVDQHPVVRTDFRVAERAEHDAKPRQPDGRVAGSRQRRAPHSRARHRSGRR